MRLVPRGGSAAIVATTTALSFLTPTAGAQFATQVVSYNQGTGGGVFDQANALGGPQGGGLGSGAVHVLTLGVGGDVTLGFDVTIADGPGVDFTLFENGFVFTFGGTGCYAEVAAVEISSDGASFARFPSRYAGPAGPVAAFTPLPVGTFAGLSGGSPVLANVMTNAIDPYDPVVSGGESFDLAWLASDPLVVAGTVDLGAIRFVRLVDLGAGTTSDSHGNPIWDSDPGSGYDLDAAAVIQHTGTLDPGQPRVDLSLDAQGRLVLELVDPDGLGDLDLATLQGSFLSDALVPVGRRRLGTLLPQTTPIPNGVRLRSAAPLAGSGLLGVLSLSVRDQAGRFSADQIVIQG
jgi:hypothetical protein